MSNKILNDIVTRTSGEVYIGVVGPVRAGKSTFIRKFMEIKVLPYVNDKILHQKIVDELPHSGEGKQITTVEPKFVPSNQVKITVDNDLTIQVRLVDCVGYVIPNAKGYLNEDGSERLVQTPWFSDAIPFDDAATIGTKKVIEAHSHIGFVITSDGSFGDFSRLEYEKVEEDIINELLDLNKPFVIILNTTNPLSETTIQLVNELDNKYNVKAIPVDVNKLTNDDIDNLLTNALEEFDITELNISVPNWINKLDDKNEYKDTFNQVMNNTTGQYRKMKDVFKIQNTLLETDLFKDVDIVNIDPGTGNVDIVLECDDSVYLNVVEDIIGEKINDKGQFIDIIQKHQKAMEVYNLIGEAINGLKEKDFSLAVPDITQIELTTPELIKDGSRYGIKIKACASVIELLKLKVDSTFEPIIGSKEQAEALIEHMLKDYETDPLTLWNSEIFGRKLIDVIKDGIEGKITNIGDDVQKKFKDSLEKVINNNRGGLIAIIL